MQYLLLIYDDEKIRMGMSPADRTAYTTEYFTLVKELQASKVYVGGNPLQPSTTAQSVRVRDGKPHTTDGPFAETREQLGGYFLVEAKDLEEARQIAARIPAARHGTIEVRPVMKVN